MDAYQEHVARKRQREAATAALPSAVPGQVEPGPTLEPERGVNGWAVFWAVALAVWLAVAVAFVAADTSDAETGTSWRRSLSAGRSCGSSAWSRSRSSAWS
jgi:hypothetical protein